MTVGDDQLILAQAVIAHMEAVRVGIPAGAAPQWDRVDLANRGIAARGGQLDVPGAVELESAFRILAGLYGSSDGATILVQADALAAWITANTVATVPSVPTSVSASGGDQQVLVSWAPPVSSGSSPITNYIVTPVGGSPRSVAAGSLSTLFTLLVNGTSYGFTVAAANAVGTGPASAVVSATPTAGAPTASPEIRINSGGPAVTEVGISWSADLDDLASGGYKHPEPPSPTVNFSERVQGPGQQVTYSPASNPILVVGWTRALITLGLIENFWDDARRELRVKTGTKYYGVTGTNTNTFSLKPYTLGGGKGLVGSFQFNVPITGGVIPPIALESIPGADLPNIVYLIISDGSAQALTPEFTPPVIPPPDPGDNNYTAIAVNVGAAVGNSGVRKATIDIEKSGVGRGTFSFPQHTEGVFKWADGTYAAVSAWVEVTPMAEVSGTSWGQGLRSSEIQEVGANGYPTSKIGSRVHPPPDQPGPAIGGWDASGHFFVPVRTAGVWYIGRRRKSDYLWDSGSGLAGARVAVPGNIMIDDIVCIADGSVAGGMVGCCYAIGSATGAAPVFCFTDALVSVTTAGRPGRRAFSFKWPPEWKSAVRGVGGESSQIGYSSEELVLPSGKTYAKTFLQGAALDSINPVIARTTYDEFNLHPENNWEVTHTRCHMPGLNYNSPVTANPADPRINYSSNTLCGVQTTYVGQDHIMCSTRMRDQFGPILSAWNPATSMFEIIAGQSESSWGGAKLTRVHMDPNGDLWAVGYQNGSTVIHQRVLRRPYTGNKTWGPVQTMGTLLRGGTGWAVTLGITRLGNNTYISGFPNGHTIVGEGMVRGGIILAGYVGSNFAANPTWEITVPQDYLMSIAGARPIAGQTTSNVVFAARIQFPQAVYPPIEVRAYNATTGAILNGGAPEIVHAPCGAVDATDALTAYRLPDVGATPGLYAFLVEDDGLASVRIETRAYSV